MSIVTAFVPCSRGKRRRKAREQERHEKGGRYKGRKTPWYS